jgi:hypothetical protein
VRTGASQARVLARLADQRELLPGTRLRREAVQRLYDWYRAGYINLRDEGMTGDE